MNIVRKESFSTNIVQLHQLTFTPETLNNRSAAPGSEPGADGQAPVVGGARNPQQMAAQKRLQQTQAQVDEVSNSISYY